MRRRLYHIAKAAHHRLTQLCWGVAILLLIMMVLLVAIQIFSRYFFQGSLPWTEEAARYLMIWGGLLGGVVAFSTDTDPAVVQIDDSHGRFRQRCKHWGSALCVLIFLGPVLWASYGFVERATLRPTEALGWNLGLVVIIIPLYSFLILAQAIFRLIAFETQPKT